MSLFLKGHLLSINSPTENDEIQADLKKDPTNLAYWIGGFDSGRGNLAPGGHLPDFAPGEVVNNTGFWSWEDEKYPWNYLKWEENSPDSTIHSQSTCVQFISNSG